MNDKQKYLRVYSPMILKKKLKILLDIDDTALISKDKGKTYTEHPRLRELIEKHNVYLLSGNPDIYEYHIKWKTKGYIPIGGLNIPKADVLINNYDLHIY